MLDASSTCRPTSAIVATMLPVATDVEHSRKPPRRRASGFDPPTGEGSRGRFELRGGGRDLFNHLPNRLLEFSREPRNVGSTLIGSRSIPFG
ncbi:hypothetical protein [Bradyrhizobium vignae]|uniref:Uncharacterized protein n=1 Tax=Bradyrhizobium vignae TaxID=1549949 RepID=A0ABS4A1Q8_9BRAD|nr:hypothetical protein [Bradyrhizobium vignae]MBP0114349.1 hypothetical protein [Bradyrhizobium vignae]